MDYTEKISKTLKISLKKLTSHTIAAACITSNQHGTDAADGTINEFSCSNQSSSEGGSSVEVGSPTADIPAADSPTADIPAADSTTADSSTADSTSDQESCHNQVSIFFPVLIPYLQKKVRSNFTS